MSEYIDNKIIESTIENFDLTETTKRTITDSFLECIDTELLRHNLLQAKDIVVQDETQTDIMKKAGRIRKDLKYARGAIEKKRKELKAYGIREQKAIESAANLFKNMIEPAEKYLDTQEKFIEIQESKMKDALYEKRKEELLAIDKDAQFDVYNLRNTTDELFEGVKLKVEKDKKERLEFQEFQRQKELKEHAASKSEVENNPFTEKSDMDMVADYLDVLEAVQRPVVTDKKLLQILANIIDVIVSSKEKL